MTKVIPFDEFENAVMEKILEKNISINNALRKQYQKTEIRKREFTGAGFFTYFTVLKNRECIIEPLGIHPTNVMCNINGISEFGEFILFLENGVIDCLEGYAFGQPWPSEITSFSLYICTVEVYYLNQGQ